MTDNEIVLNLLDFYKQKGIDLYKVLDDPTFKALSLQTRLDAIKHYASMIQSDAPHGFAARDFKQAIKSMFIQSGVGAVAGALTSAGVAATFNHGRISPGAPIMGAIFGAASGLVNSGFSIANKHSARSMMNNHINDVVENPTDANALRYLTANHVRGELHENTKKILDKVQENVDKNINADLHNKYKEETIRFNHDYGNTLKTS